VFSTGKDRYYRETVIKFWFFGVLLTGSLLFVGIATGWVLILVLYTLAHIFYGFELRNVVLSEQGVDLYR
jgi:hypothetical protein